MKIDQIGQLSRLVVIEGNSPVDRGFADRRIAGKDRGDLDQLRQTVDPCRPVQDRVAPTIQQHILDLRRWQAVTSL